MILFFIIAALLVTFAVYAFISVPLVLYIGIGVAIAIFLTSLYIELESNFYLQSAFIFINSIAQLILIHVIPGRANAIAVWLLYTLSIFGWMKDWVEHFTGYYYDRYTYEEGRRSEFEDFVDARQNIKYYLFCGPYLVFNCIIPFFYKTPDFGFLIYISPVCVLLCAVIFLIAFKIRGIDPIGYGDKIDSFGALFCAIGNYFKHLFTFKRRRRSLSKKSKSSYSGYKGTKSTKPSRTRLGIKKSGRSDYSTSGSSYYSSYSSSSSQSRKSYKSGGKLSVWALILPIIFFIIIVVFAILEGQSIISSHVGDLSELVMDLVFQKSKWFALTKLVFNECLMELNADTFINLLTFIPLGIIYLALLILAAVLELALSAVYALLGLILALLAAILSFAFTFVPGLIAVGSVIVTIISFTHDHSKANKISSCIFTSAQIMACVYYFIVLFSHRS